MGTNSGLNRPRQGTQGSSHGQSARFRARSKRERRKLVAHLESLYRRRLSLKEKRNEIREERMSLDGLEAKLLGSIGRSLNLGVALEQSLIQDLYTEIIAKKDELGGLQYEYDQAEEDYDAAEAVLVEQEDIENGKLDHYDVASQSSHVESEDPAGDHVHPHFDDFENLNRQQSKQRPPSSQNFNGYRKALGKDESNQNSKNEEIPRPKVEAEDRVENKNSDYDLLEATFKMRVTTTPVGQTEHNVSPGVTSPKSKQVDGEVSIRSRSRRWESMSQPGSIRHDDSAPRERQYLDSGRKIWSDSGVTTRRKGLIRRRSRVIWWLFNTFGSSGTDYLERTRDKQQLSSSKHLDDETWARRVFDYWTRRQIPAAVAVTPNATGSTEVRGATHVEDQSLGGSYLLLPSGPNQLRHSVENIDRLFADTRSSPRTLYQQRDLADELSSLLTPARSL